MNCSATSRSTSLSFANWASFGFFPGTSARISGGGRRAMDTGRLTAVSRLRSRPDGLPPDPQLLRTIPNGEQSPGDSFLVGNHALTLANLDRLLLLRPPDF
jgi:hypothetical protein